MNLPRRLHHIWVGSPVPDHLATYRDTWRTHHPGWELNLWGDKQLRALNLTNQHLIDQAHELVPPWGIGQFISDVARLELIHRFGGIYVDFDFEALTNIEPLIGDAAVFAAWEIDDVWLANGLIGSTPGHPFIGELIKRLPGSVKRRKGRRPAVVSGPKFLTRTYRALEPADMVTLPQASVFPYGWEDLDTPKAQPPWPPGTYAVHHWANQRAARANGERR